MRRFVGLILLLALGAVGCSENTAPGGGASGNGGAAGIGGAAGVGGAGGERPWRSAVPEEADAACQAWCDAGRGEEVDCYERCRYQLAQTCGAHDLALLQCAIDCACSTRDPRCADQFRTFQRCEDEVSSICEGCAADTRCYRGPSGGESTCGCFAMGGDCDATWREGYCRVAVDSGECADLASCRAPVSVTSWTCEGEVPACIEPLESIPRCWNDEIGPIEPCCELPAPPEVPDACAGDESLVNPTSCTPTGEIVTHRLTHFQVLGDCNVGYDLDGCDGPTCRVGGLVAGEGIDGVDNALAGIGSSFGGAGIRGANQVFADLLCGLTDRDPEPGCERQIPSYDLQFAIDLNVGEACANVDVIVAGAHIGSKVLNLSGPTSDGRFCLSGKLGAIPTSSGGVDTAFGNTRVRMTLTEGGFSNGLLGATLEADFVWSLIWAIISGAADPGIYTLYDINDDLSGDPERVCNAMSATFEIGGVVEPRGGGL